MKIYSVIHLMLPIIHHKMLVAFFCICLVKPEIFYSKSENAILFGMEYFKCRIIVM